MVKEFKQIKFQKKTLELIKKIESILEEYSSKGIKVTVRQLFYQLVARDIIENNLATYQKISRDVTKARYTGLLDWNSIVDNSTFLDISNFYDNVEELIQAAINSYQLNRWEGQENYIEVWCEKDALRSIVLPISKKYQVSLFIPGGRVSTTSIKEAVDRIEYAHNQGKRCKILYLGDHDPCGLDMVLRDIPKRLRLLFKDKVEIIPIALTKKQIEDLNIPTDQITKDKDTNKDWYQDITGTKKCWELDALDPEIIQNLIEEKILDNLDILKFEEIKQIEEQDKQKIELK